MSMSSESEEDEEDCGDSTKAKHMYQNKIHARLAREKRRQVEELLEARVQELLVQGDKYRMQVDDKYMDTMRKTNQLNVTSTGSIYLDGNGAGTVDSLVLAESLCSNCYKDELIRQSEIMKMEAREDAANVCALPMLPNKTSPGGLKDPSSERRERNRIHAKRTRVRRKRRAEVNKYLCREMEAENRILQSYLFSIGVLLKSQVDQALLESNAFKEKFAFIDRPTSYVDIEVPVSIPVSVQESRSVIYIHSGTHGMNGASTKDTTDYANLLMNFTHETASAAASMAGTEAGDRPWMSSPDSSVSGSSSRPSFGATSIDGNVNCSSKPSAISEACSSGSVSGGGCSDLSSMGEPSLESLRTSSGRKKNKSNKKFKPYNYYSAEAVAVRGDSRPFGAFPHPPAMFPHPHMPPPNPNVAHPYPHPHLNAMAAAPQYSGFQMGPCPPPILQPPQPGQQFQWSGLDMSLMPPLVYYGLFYNSPMESVCGSGHPWCGPHAYPPESPGSP